MSAERAEWPWRLALLSVVAPVLLMGFAASALANRWIFALWAVVVSLAGALALRRGFEVWTGRPAPVAHIAERVLVVLAPGAALFGLIVARHREVLDLGWRAVSPGSYTPVATAPDTYLFIATGLALLGAVAWYVGKRAVARAAAAHRPARRPAQGQDLGGSNDG